MALRSVGQHSSDPSKLLVVPGNASIPMYRTMLEEMAATGVCPLDSDQYLEITGGEDTLREIGGWILAKNRHPYPNTERDREGVVGHMIAFPQRHVESPRDLTRTERDAYWDILGVAQEDFGASPCATFMRLGGDNIGAVGGTIAHLHFQIVVPHLDPATGFVPGHGTSDAQLVIAKFG